MQETRNRILSITQINNDQPLLARFRDYGFLSLGGKDSAIYGYQTGIHKNQGANGRQWSLLWMTH